MNTYSINSAYWKKSPTKKCTIKFIRVYELLGDLSQIKFSNCLVLIKLFLVNLDEKNHGCLKCKFRQDNMTCQMGCIHL